MNWPPLESFWPELMPARYAAQYVGERSAQAYRRRVGTVYPRPIRIAGRGQVWRKKDLDQVIANLGGSSPTIASAADVL